MQFDRPDDVELGGDRAFWRLYEDTFPIEERDPRDVVLRGLGGDVHVVCARAAGETVGFTTTTWLPSVGAALLGFLAVDPGYRRDGLGARLLREARPPRGVLVWEVEDPDEARDPEIRAGREARIAWFLRQGAKPVHARYIQPPVDGTNPVPMRLLTLGEPVPPAADLIRAIHDEKYGRFNRIDRVLMARLRGEAPTT